MIQLTASQIDILARAFLAVAALDSGAPDNAAVSYVDELLRPSERDTCERVVARITQLRLAQ